MANKLNGEELQGMVRHWLKSPAEGYLGSGYGSSPLELLQKPMTSGLGDAFVQKMENDILLLTSLPKGAVSVYFEDKGNDSKVLHVVCYDSKISVDGSGAFV